MNTPNSSQFKKVFIVLVILLVLLPVIIMLKSQRKPQPPKIGQVNLSQNVTSSPQKPTLTPYLVLNGQMVFNDVPKTVKTGETFTVSVGITTKGEKVYGSDAIVKFDKSFLSAENITEAAYFAEFPRKTIDNSSGVLKISAFSPKNNVSAGSIQFFTVTFTAKKRGATRLTFDFQRGSTNLSTVVEKGTSRNILGSVGNTTIVIE